MSEEPWVQVGGGTEAGAGAGGDNRDATAASLERRKLAEPGEGEHPLQFRWTFWFNKRLQGARTQENYEKNIKRVATFASVRGSGALRPHAGQ